MNFIKRDAYDDVYLLGGEQRNRKQKNRFSSTNRYYVLRFNWTAGICASHAIYIRYLKTHFGEKRIEPTQSNSQSKLDAAFKSAFKIRKDQYHVVNGTCMFDRNKQHLLKYPRLPLVR